MRSERSGPALVRLLPQEQVPDAGRVEDAVRALLVALGRDLDDPHLSGTPARVASALLGMLTPEAFDATTFPNEEDGAEHYDGVVVTRNIAFHSLCAHHLLPFVGHAHVGYLPGRSMVGLSKLARVVEHFARDLQVQERLTTQVADWLHDHLDTRGVGVVIESEHLCMSLRGVRARGSVTVTSAMRGRLRTDPALRQEFLAHALPSR